MSVGVMTFDQRADAAAAAVLSDLLAKIAANHEGAMEGSDLECLHDFRVATRRTRSVQRELKHAFPPGPLRHFRGEFKWLQTVTGPARDLDVYVDSFDDSRRLVPADMRADLEPLLELLQARRSDARREMVAALSSERAAAALADWRSLLEELEQLPDSDRPDASRRIGDLSGARIRKVYKRIVRLGRPITRSSPSEAYHELRKQGKELRYLLELFGTKLYPSEVVKPMVKSLKALQDVLGRHQDRQVQVALLLGIREELAGRSRAALTPLIENLMRDQLAARDQFAQRFEAIASKQQRTLVHESF